MKIENAFRDFEEKVKALRNAVISGSPDAHRLQREATLEFKRLNDLISKTPRGALADDVEPPDGIPGGPR